MAFDDVSPEEEAPNLPVVRVRGVTHAEAMRLYERYKIEFTPPGYAELKLCEVVIELEELVESLSRRK
jgi:hypothetical protein